MKLQRYKVRVLDKTGAVRETLTVLAYNKNQVRSIMHQFFVSKRGGPSKIAIDREEGLFPVVAQYEYRG